MSDSPGFRVIFKFSSWFINLFNIRLLIKRPDEKQAAELISKFKKLSIIVAPVKKFNA